MTLIFFRSILKFVRFFFLEKIVKKKKVPDDWLNVVLTFSYIFFTFASYQIKCARSLDQIPLQIDRRINISGENEKYTNIWNEKESIQNIYILVNFIHENNKIQQK